MKGEKNKSWIKKKIIQYFIRKKSGSSNPFSLKHLNERIEILEEDNDRLAKEVTFWKEKALNFRRFHR